jgi:hypothetical protein
MSTVLIQLPPALYARFDDVARAVGEPIEIWLADQLEWLADWPPTVLRMGARAPGQAAYDDGCDRYVGDALDAHGAFRHLLWYCERR